MRSYQYYAASAISQAVAKRKWSEPGQRGGYIWHTTGSGKTMTSFKSAQLIANSGDADKVVFLMDRIELGKDQWDADFAKALFETVDLTSLVQVGALPSYNAGDVEAMEIMLPDVSEQHQIGAYFRQLDNLITLHQRKEVCSELVSVLLCFQCFF